MVQIRSSFWYYVFLVFLTLATFKYLGPYRNYYASTFKKTKHLNDDERLADFYETWCGIRKHQTDWKKIQQPCDGLMQWGSTKKGDWNEQTDASESRIISKDIRPTYEFSRIVVESRTGGGARKKVGGDSWRVHLRGPSSPVTTVFDNQNGTYEVAFLLFEPGLYRIQAYLEHSICNGLKEPPDNWFIIGNAQGKYQPYGSLGDDHAYISKKMNATEVANIHVHSQTSAQYMQAVNMLMKTRISFCDISCNMIWDGYGRWVSGSWLPYKTVEGFIDDASPSKISKRASNVHATYNGILGFYGDSVMEQFYNNIKLFGNLCKFFTGGCRHSYNWVYNIKGHNTSRAKIENDDKDFNVTRILEEVARLVQNPAFNRPDSVLFINFGLHFTESTTFQAYKILISGIISLLRNKVFYTGKVLWRTTTSLNKHKLGGKHDQSRRFLNHQRVTLFNAYATDQMCSAGIPVLDLFPLTDSYPNGTGIRGFKFDAVHYEHSTFAAAERYLEEVFKWRQI